MIRLRCHGCKTLWGRYNGPQQQGDFEPVLHVWSCTNPACLTSGSGPSPVHLLESYAGACAAFEESVTV